VFAFRAKSVLTYSDAPLPFYMQPALGGSEDLRGYRPYRFRGNNLLVMSAEYRWEVFSGLDMALFADAGRVAMKKSDLITRDLETSGGFGLRFNQRNRSQWSIYDKDSDRHQLVPDAASFDLPQVGDSVEFLMAELSSAKGPSIHVYVRRADGC